MLRSMMGLMAVVWGVGGLAQTQGAHFDHVVTVMFENTDYDKALAAPFFGQLASQGVNFTNFNAEAHPSQANYIALTSGSTNGVSGDGTVDVNSTNIVDLLESKGLTWKIYVEAWPGNCYAGTKKGTYARKHNPFISYVNIHDNPERCAHIVDASELDLDVANGQLPNYVFYVPDLNDDGHDTGADYASGWYQQRFGSLLANPNFMTGTLLITTFDESGGFFGNHTYTSLYGPMVRSGEIGDSVNHYSLLRMIEDNWSLGTFGRKDDTATLVPDIWK